jgi:hypothetical protein
LAFAKTQENWRMRPAVPLYEKLVLVTLEPVWSIFDPASPCYWARSPVEFSPFFSLHLANPIYWLLAIVLVIVGACKRWLTAYEVSLSAGLLLIPYVLRAHEMCMAGMGRFAAVVFPVYIVNAGPRAGRPSPRAAD